MKSTILKITAIAVFIFNLSSNAQLCQDYHNDRFVDCFKCKDESFDYYGQSKSAALKLGQVERTKVIFYGEKEYKVSFCTEIGFYPIHYRLIDPNTGEVLYDNKTDKYAQSVGFSVEHARTIVIEVKLLAKQRLIKGIGGDMSCLGILIQWKKMAPVGVFEQ